MNIERSAAEFTELSDAEIVALAYKLSAGTERYNALFHALTTRLDNAAAPQPDAPPPDEVVASSLSQLEPHFENATDLLHDVLERKEKPKHSVRSMESDLRPCMLVSATGRLNYVNNAARQQFDVTIGDYLSQIHFEPGHFARFKKALIPPAEGTLTATFSLARADKEGFTQVTLRHVTNDDDNTTVGQIVALTSSWNDGLAQRFKSAMNLTPVELDIVRTIVMGRRLKHLAEARGRSVGTVRLQAKQLLKKLSLNSQTELVSLYASFGELTIGSSAENSGGQAEADPQKIHVLPDGRNLCYAMAGPRGGMPALFFPALIGGITLTPFMRQCLFESDILLITVWRPGLGQSDPDGPPDFESFARYCADIEHLLDELDISACPVIGHVTSAMFACAMAHYSPERVSHVVCVNGIVPSYSGPHVQHLSKIERLRASVLRSAPKIARMLVHSLLAKIESGFDDEFLQSYLKSPQDQKTIRDDAIRSGFRNAHDIITAQSYDGFLHELQLAALDWRPLYDNPTKKITYLIGDENHCYTPKAVGVFMADRAKLHFATVENAGHLLLYQNFKRILQQVKS